MTLQCIQPKIMEDTHKPQGCKHKEGGAGATLGCEIGHARVPPPANGYGNGMGHQIGDVERKRERLWGDKTYMPVLQAECKWITEAELVPQNSYTCLTNENCFSTGAY